MARTVQPSATLLALLEGEHLEQLEQASEDAIAFLNHVATLPAEQIVMLEEVLRRDIEGR